MEYKWVIHHGPATVKLCWDLKYHPSDFLPPSWLLNYYCFVYMTFFCCTRVTYVNIFIILIMLKALFHLFLFLLSLLQAFLFSSNFPQTTSAEGMDTGSPLRKSAEGWCCCRYPHFFFIITSLCLSVPSGRVLPFRLCLHFFHFITCLMPPTHLCPIKCLWASSMSFCCSHALKRSLCPAELNGRPSKETVRNREQNQVFFPPRSMSVINTNVKNQKTSKS